MVDFLAPGFFAAGLFWVGFFTMALRAIGGLAIGFLVADFFAATGFGAGFLAPGFRFASGFAADFFGIPLAGFFVGCLAFAIAVALAGAFLAGVATTAFFLPVVLAIGALAAGALTTVVGLVACCGFAAAFALVVVPSPTSLRRTVCKMPPLR